jgi:hypothetical protein
MSIPLLYHDMILPMLIRQKSNITMNELVYSHKQHNEN